MHKTNILIFLLILVSCDSLKKEKGQALYTTYCAQCHAAPDIQDLPKNIWASSILPDMASRMGIQEQGYDPMKDLSFAEMDAIIKSGVFPARPTISPGDWAILKEYILRKAPDSLPGSRREPPLEAMKLFTSNRISLDSNGRSTITYLKFRPQRHELIIGNVTGQVSRYGFAEKKLNRIGQFGSAVVDYAVVNDKAYVTTIGNLRPSQIPVGRIFIRANGVTKAIPQPFHRPVNTLVNDLNDDGKSELVVSEFGDLTGSLGLLSGGPNNTFSKTVLLQRPGPIRVVNEDMDNDGLTDLVALTAQGDEGITILYQQEGLKFKSDQVIRFSPVFGSSWFVLVDYDHDGDKDIITVHGDNADKSYVSKPYHGMRIHINEGNNTFKEVYFHPLNGATRVVAEDFDKDGDVDFALLSTFPDYANNTPTFVYLENKNSMNYEFIPRTFAESDQGRWFLMDTGDVDNDGDTDIIISAFTLAFTALPTDMVEMWKEKDADIMVLLNQLNDVQE